jgi:hypothetical protein
VSEAAVTVMAASSVTAQKSQQRNLARVPASVAEARTVRNLQQFTSYLLLFTFLLLQASFTLVAMHRQTLS